LKSRWEVVGERKREIFRINALTSSPAKSLEMPLQLFADRRAPRKATNIYLDPITF